MKHLFVLSFLLVFSAAISQSLSYRKYDISEELQNSQVFDIYQDKNGFIWMATYHGACKYDGAAFTTYTADNGLLSNTVYSIYEDRFGRIWLLYKDIVLSYYYRNKIYQYKHLDKIKAYKKDKATDIRSFQVLPDSSLLIGSLGHGLYKIHDSGKIEEIAPPDKKKPGGFVLHKYKDNFYSYIQAGAPNLKANIRIDVEDKTIYSQPIMVNDRNVFHLQRKNKHVIFTSSGKLLDLYNDRVCDSLSGPGAIISLYEDSDSCLWVGYVTGGVKKFPPNKSFTHTEYKLYFRADPVSKVLEDREHGFWIATLFDGIRYVPYKEMEYLELSEKVPENETTTYIETDGISKVFIGTTKGLVKVYEHGRLIKTLQVEKSEEANYIRCIYYDAAEKKLYVAGQSSAYYFDSADKVHKLGFGCMNFMKEKDVLYAGSFSWVYTIQNGKQKNIHYYVNGKTENFRAQSTGIYKGQVLFGNPLGLYYMKGDTIYKQEKGLPEKLKISTLVSNSKHLYMGTFNQGIVEWDGNSYRRISDKEGFISNYVLDLFMENDSILWASTKKGVCQYNVNQRKVLRVLNKKKGLNSDMTGELAVLNDTLYITNSTGVTFFNVNTPFLNNTPPAIYINDIKADTVSYLGQDWIHLGHANSYISFYVSGLAFRQTEKAVYKYRLKGNSDEWRTSSSNVIQFAFLPPGNYIFEVLAENEDGLASAQPAVFHFTIHKPWWKRLWFILGALAVTVLIIALVFYTRIRRIKEKNKILEQLTGYKQQALAMQMNPHFLFNSLSSIQSYVLSEKPLKASKYLAKFSRLMRKSLEHSRKEFIPVQEEIDTLRLYMELEAIRKKRPFTFRFEYDEEQLMNIHIPPMLIQPHVENAIKHGLLNLDEQQQGVIEIRFSMKGKLLYCYIEDNGIGISKAKVLKLNARKLHRSAGMEVTTTRLELLCTNMKFPFVFSVTDKSEQGAVETGTVVQFLIPYVYDAKSADS